MSKIFQRNYYLDKITDSIKKVPIIVIIGARQVGKTTLLNNITLDKPHLMFNGQDPEDASLFNKNSSLEQWLKINLNRNLDGYIIIDEFQYINDISIKLKILTDKNPNIKIICTGSSSLNILQNVKESLAGRVRIIEVYSLSLPEYILFNDEKLFDEYNKYDINTDNVVINNKIKYFMNEYMIFGGFPRQALEKSTDEKSDMLNDIFRTYLQRDVRQFVDNVDFVGFNKMLKLIALQIGNLVNVNKLSNDSGLSYKKTEEYLNLLDQMYIIKLIDPFQTNKRKVITKMKKVYFTDLGLRNVIIKDFRDINSRNDSGALFENFVLLELLKQSPNTYEYNYYRTIDKSEVDFYINTMRQKILIETKYSNYQKMKKFRNIEAFKNIETPDKIFVINKDLNEVQDNYRFLPAELTCKIFQ